MKVIQTNIKDVLIIEPKVFGDDRGFFFESYNQKTLQEVANLNENFVQDNHSKSKKGVLRGLHFQNEPYQQGKLLRVVVGEIFDVAVDIRKNSPTFGQYTSVILSAENKWQFWIPKGFAHGFLTLSESAELLYKATDFYHPESEQSLLWNDKKININWAEVMQKYNISENDLILSAKDKNGISFENL